MNLSEYTMYAIGGNQEKGNLIGVYSSSSNAWRTHPYISGSSQIDGIQGHQSILLPDGCIYIVGGYLPSEK